MNITRAASGLVLAIGIVVMLIYGQDLLIPFVFAVLIWFLVNMVKSILDKVPFIRHRFPGWLKSLVTSIFIFTVLGFVSSVLTVSINSLAKSYERYESNVTKMTDQVNQALQINAADMISKFMADFDFGSILQSIFSSLSGLVGSTFMILIYLLFVFLEANSFSTKIRALCASDDQYTSVREMLERIEKSITHYIGLKTLVSVITGVLSYVVLLIVGVDSPVFWAFLIFLLNFIPTIGSLIGTLFPAVFSLLQFGQFQPFFIILIFVGAIQVLVGNVLEPKLMGNSLNISALVTILALSFWGAIWGITGMFLSVPITVMMVIIFAQFPSTRPIAIMLSEKGKV
jgi:predicted PurR-regulated permease PerM